MSWLDDIRARLTSSARSVDVQTLLSELAKLEGEFAASHGLTVALLGLGALSRASYDSWHQRRDDLFNIQMEIYNSVHGVLSRLPGDQGSQIPRPTRWPDLPPFVERGGTAPSAAELQTSVAGLGAAPVVIWAILVASVLIRLAVIYAIVRVIQMGFDTAARLYAARQNTQRYQTQVESQKHRFDRCIAAGGTPASCGQLFPTPEPPIEQPPPERNDPVFWGIVITTGVLSLGLIGYLFYEYATPGRWGSYSSTPTRVRTLSSGDIPKVLRGGR